MTLLDAHRSTGRTSTFVIATLFLLGTTVVASTSAPKRQQEDQSGEHARTLDLANRAIADAEKLLPKPGPVQTFYPQSRQEEKRKTKEMTDAVELLRKADAALSGFLKTHPDDNAFLWTQVHLDFLKKQLPIEDAGKAANRPDFLPSPARDPMKTLDHILELDPNDPEAYFRKAELYANPYLRGLRIAPDFAAATDSVRKAVDRSPDNARYRETLADLLLEQDHEKEAMDTLRPLNGGHHPAYLLLVDWSKLPLPAGAVLNKEATQIAVQMLAATGKDNPGLRERCYDVTQSVSDIESFYSGYWKDFHFSPEGAGEIKNGEHIRDFRASFLWQNGGWGLVGSAMSQQALDTGLTIFVSEHRKNPKPGDGSPAVRCVLSISNDRSVDDSKP